MTNRCEVCFNVFTKDDLEDDVTIPADCCGRMGLCKQCREAGQHDCDEDVVDEESENG